MNFDQFSASAPKPKEKSVDTTPFIISLFDIIENQRNQRDQACKFCSLLFDAIALPQNDPFNHPAIKDYMPEELQGKVFQTWTKGLRWHDRLLKSPHPFGQTRIKVKIEQDETDPNSVREIRREDLEAAEQAGLIASASATGATLQAASQDTNNDRQSILMAVGNAGSLLTSALSMMDHKLPAVVTVEMHNVSDADAGLLKIAVLGYGNKVQASLSVLSEFNLRVASSYMLEDGGKSLRYGRVIKDEIDVEQGCAYWLNHCIKYHEDRCAKPAWSLKLPSPSGPHFRLIDVQERKVVQFHADGAEKPLPSYAALSYVWGKAGEEALNLHFKDLSKGVYHIDNQAKKVASTISDAIQVTQRLDIRYLWADSLCVIQKHRDGDDEPEARKSQIDQMGSIFGYASVVIIAASGEDAESGLAGITLRRQPGQIIRDVREDVNVLLPVEYDKSYGKWDTRAWTLQEKLLSKRMLVFDSNHVSFHCRHGVLREDMPAVHAGNGPPSMAYLSMPPSSTDRQIAARTWNNIPVLLRSPFFNEYTKLLAQYTSRDRSKSNDILQAVMGLLKVLEDMRHLNQPGDVQSDTKYQKSRRVGRTRTLHGLPEEFLDLALLWQPPAVLGTHLTRRMNDQLPSWSWAGWEVSKDPARELDAKTKHKAHPGIRFEEPFWVSGNDDLSLKKFAATGADAEERFRPLTMWYRCLKASTSSKAAPAGPKVPPKAPHLTAGIIEPVNKHGLGLVSGSDDVDAHFFQKIVRFRTGQESENPDPPFLSHNIPIDSRNLICETETAKFRLRQKDKKPRIETIYERGEPIVEGKTLHIVEAEILDNSDNAVGYVIPTDQQKTVSSDLYDFILLSESQYWGNETRIDITGFPLYNVMVVEWDNRREFATRLGLGKISKPAWRVAAEPTKKVVVLK